jgi:mannose-6-phosphate isomerase-like protein (cupin superfamily)
METGAMEEQMTLAMDDLEAFYDEPGEYGWIMEGHKHGFGATTVITTRTMPGGGPPLHTHGSEEVHVLPESTFAYVIGERRFVVHGPCMVRIPPETPHTFLNIGDEPVRMVAFFPCDRFWSNYQELGPNPLLDGTPGGQA